MFIYKCKFFIKGRFYTLVCEPLNSIKKPIQKILTFRGSKNWMRRQLINMKANDVIKWPPTKNRVKTYNKMLNDAEQGNDIIVYIQSHLLPKQVIIREKTFLESSLSTKEWLERKVKGRLCGNID